MTKLPLLVILFFIGGTAFAQTHTETEIKALLCHKWKLTHMERDGKKIAMPAEFGESFLDFKADGTILLIDSDGEEKSTWTYNHKTKTVTTESEGEIQKFEIVNITETELHFKGIVEEITMGMYLKRVK